MREELKKVHEAIIEMDRTNTGVNGVWCTFKSKLEELIKKHVLHKTARTKDSLPWITSDLKKLIRKRDRLYKRKKTSGDKKTANKFKEIKRIVQRELRRAYWKYIESIVTPQEDDNQYTGSKRFWIYIKYMYI
jgi:hypothetical protein